MEIKIKDNSDLFRDRKEKAVIAALEAIGLTAERHAKEKCPVDTGLLRNSITHAVSGGPTAINSYKAEFGLNINPKTGKRYRASSKNAGDVGSGSYSGNAPTDPEDMKSAYIGTNVKYAYAVETKEKAQHNTGQAHFLRDAVATHGAELKRVAETQLKKTNL